ncbi:MAG: putative lipid II flippase FtsW, partial [Pseudomonadota bacterium]
EADKAVGHQSTYYLIRQAIFIVIGLFAGFIAFQIPVAGWQKMAPYLFLLGLFLLVLVLIPGVGRNVNGSQRWLSLFVINLQPSELMKLFAAMYVADYAVRKAPQMDSIVKGFLPMVAVMVLVGFLLLREPDFGAFAVIAAISISILWLGGINVKIFVALLALLPVAIYALIVSSPYRMQRVIGFMDPWADPYGKGYQLSHALIAFGRGEWFGVGLGASVEKLLYLPEAHTDFLLAVIAEELGFVGVLTVLGLFCWIVIRAFGIGKEAVANERYFAALLAQGLGVWMGVQGIINIGVNMGVLPTKGLTLPLLSFGGSGILANCIAMAVLLRIDFENRRLQKGLPA